MDLSEAPHTTSSNEILQLPDVATESVSAAQTATGIVELK